MSQIWTPDNCPHIWVPRQHNVLADKHEDPIVIPSPRLAGLVRAVLRNSDGSIAQDTGWFKNLIVNEGLRQHMPSVGSPFPAYAAIGSSGSAPTVGQTALVSQLSTWQNGLSNTQGYNYNAGNPYDWRQRTWRWDQGDGTGTIAELGCANYSNGSRFLARTLIVDGGGSPTTIVKGANQILDVTWEWRMYIPTVDATGTISISGVNYDYIARPLDIDDTYWYWFVPGSALGVEPNSSYFAAYTGTLTNWLNDGNSITGNMGNESSPETRGGQILTTGAYSGSGTYWFTYDIQAGLDDWVGTVRTVTLGGSGGDFQVQYTISGGSTGIVKTGDQLLRLAFKREIDRY